VTADVMSEAEVIDVFREAGAILEGHFILTSGLRSPVFLQKARGLGRTRGGRLPAPPL